MTPLHTRKTLILRLFFCAQIFLTPPPHLYYVVGPWYLNTSCPDQMCVCAQQVRENLAIDSGKEQKLWMMSKTFPNMLKSSLVSVSLTDQHQPVGTRAAHTLHVLFQLIQMN